MKKIKRKREHRYTTVAIMRIDKETKNLYIRDAKKLGLSYSELMRWVLKQRYE